MEKLKPYSVFFDPYNFKKSVFINPSNFNKGPKTQWNVFNTSNYPGTWLYNSIWAIAIEDSNNIWIGTYGGGLIMITNNGTSFTQPFTLGYQGSCNFITSIVIFNGEKWIGTQFAKDSSDDHGGLVQFDTVTANIYGSSNNKEITPPYQVLPTNNIYSLAADSSNLWIGTNGGGLVKHSWYNSSWHWDPYTNFSQIPGITPSKYNNQVTALCIDGDYLWVGTYGGELAKLDIGGNSWVTPSIDLSNYCPYGNKVTSLVKDTHGNLWIGTDFGSGLIQYNGGSNPVHLSGEYITSLALEGTNILWVGTRFNGLFKFDIQGNPYPIENIKSIAGGLPDDFITALAVDGSNIWIGTYSGGLACLIP